MNAVVENKKNRKLDVHEILTWLEEDEMVTADNAHMVRMLSRGKAFEDKHPLEIIAERNWVDEKKPRPLTIDALSEWFAQRVGLPYFRIDPLKVDVTQVTDVMSFAYAQRFNVLAVKVEAHSITVATAQPFDRDWESELSRIHNKEFKQVIASPEEIRRYLVEFYTVSKSVFGAQNDSQRGLGDLQNLESLMELGRVGKLDANDQHVVNIVDWLLQYAFDQRASDIHLEPRREMCPV
ncbi:MAG: type II/IV secretion system protein, partial [Gammaproteobacteria bacterium]|nr:type II/IV secretion system protein [Gammaproteobacteria bacterium]